MTGNEIRELRGDWTRRMFAGLIGCTERTIERWEKHGKDPIIMLPVYHKRLQEIAYRRAVGTKGGKK